MDSSDQWQAENAEGSVLIKCFRSPGIAEYPARWVASFFGCCLLSLH